MLYQSPNIITPTTFNLLNRLMADKQFDQFILVGGTSLALQIGHRFSIDLDLFTQDDFDTQLYADYLVEKYDFFIDYIAHNTLKGFIDGIKCDFISHKYRYNAPIVIESELRLASILDIASMKLNAISHNGTRYKDFIDMYFLLEYHSLKTYLDAFAYKYPKTNPIIALKGLGYFEDINFEIDKPILLKNTTFDQISQRLLSAIQQPNKVFDKC